MKISDSVINKVVKYLNKKWSINSLFLLHNFKVYSFINDLIIIDLRSFIQHKKSNIEIRRLNKSI
jgi:hypothetical protein